ncbi:MAG TPA: class I SAM-dependent methyltransferase [Rhizobiales bacterium]|nr:class I SAM-dependent methyltransferase [Hyphomicrobiales bacterium]
MCDVYNWAYLNPRNARLLDNEAVVNTLLWGNSGRLRRTLLAEITAGDRVLQAAHVYGRLVAELAKTVGPAGRLEVIDVTPLQAAMCRRKLRAFPHARARIADAVYPGEETYDVVVCFFLLHELPKVYKCAVVDALLARLSPGGKVVFIDYHAPARWHPLRGLMRQVFARLEPFAEAMWQHEIADFASDPEPYVWRTETFFGGLYQKTVAGREALTPEGQGPAPGLDRSC